MAKYITQNNLKKNTLANIFIFILNKKQTTRREIEYETGFSWGTVSANVSFLIEKGYVVEEKSEQNAGAGRTTYILKPSSGPSVSIGLDINRSGLSCEVVALDARVIMKLDAEFTAQTQSEVISQAEELCKKAIGLCKEKGLLVFSVGIAMQGAVNGRLGVSKSFPNITDWKPYNVKEHFSKKLQLPVYLGHDPKCMLLGEMYRRKYDDCVLLRVDEGIGMAVSLDGRILDDTERLELGHTLAVPGGRRCSCGKNGCLEAYASLSAIKANEGSELEKELSAAGEYLAKAIYNTCVLFKPEKLILTGKASSLDSFVQSARALVNGAEIDVAVDPEISAAYGAALEAIRSAVKAFVI